MAKSQKPTITHHFKINHLVQDKDELHYQLINNQHLLRKMRQDYQAKGILVLVNGMENSGKGEAVTQLREWLDPRLLKVHATMGQHPSHYQPIWQRHSKQMPRQGEIAVYFGNWYADLFRYVFDSGETLNRQKLNQMLEDIEEFETDLYHNGIIIVKCWFHVDKKILLNRLSDDVPDPEQLYYLDWRKKSHVKAFQMLSEQLLSQQKNWYKINGNDENQANITFANIVLNTLQQAVNPDASHQIISDPSKKLTPFHQHPVPKQLQAFDDKKIKKSDYKAELKQKQVILSQLLRERGQRHVIFVFEGMDAAGKGGAIKRIIKSLDPREYDIHCISAPLDYEKQYPYLWRFWTRLPEDKMANMTFLLKATDKKVQKYPHHSKIAIFDRSWYGRVLVERVEGFATDAEWQRAYDEINRFEKDLVQSGAIILKFWLAISKDEQLKRFQVREETPSKNYKITDEDWRNRAKWQEYVQSASDMLALTNTQECSWHIVATNDKLTARLQVLDDTINQLSKSLKNS